MRRSVSFWPIVALLVCMLGAFLWSSSALSRSIQEVEVKNEQARVRLSQAEIEQGTLKDTLAIVETESYIENQARTEYGYMKPDEIRFVITNPEVLYGTEATPIP